MFRITSLVVLAACSTSAPKTQDPEPQPAVQRTVGPRPASWVEPRVAEVRERLSKDDAGKALLATIDAHGGLGPWLGHGTLSFDFDYQPVGDPAKRRYSRSQVDVWSRKVRQVELGEDADAMLGYDGKEAWIVPSKKAFPSPAAFWATTPFYFVALPWVLADDGTNVTLLESTRVFGVESDAPLQTLRVGFESGVGDAPDDYYILHLHPNHQIAAIRYVVSYPAFFKDGGHSPEKLLVYGPLASVDGLWVATHYDSYMWNDGQGGPLQTRVEIANVTFGETLDVAGFSKP